MANFEHGEVVYWCENLGNGKYQVNYGIVDQEYYDRVAVDLLSVPETRRINGIPFDEFKDDRYHKLPKGWTYNTKLFEETNDPLPEGLKELKIQNPVDIKKAYENGWLVKKSTINPGYMSAEITKEGYRIKVDYGLRGELLDRRTCVGVYRDKLYRDYESAEREMETELAEFQRQAALSDDEWSKEQIEKSLTKYRMAFGVSEEIIDKCRDYLFNLTNIFDVVTRVTTKGLEWKYDRNRKWMSVVVQ